MRDEAEIRADLSRVMGIGTLWYRSTGAHYWPAEEAARLVADVEPLLAALHTAEAERDEAEYLKSHYRALGESLDDYMRRAIAAEAEVARLSVERNQAHEALRAVAEKLAAREAAEAKRYAMEPSGYHEGTRDAFDESEQIVRAALAAAAGAPKDDRAHGRDCDPSRGFCGVIRCGCWCHMNPAYVAGAPKEGQNGIVVVAGGPPLKRWSGAADSSEEGRDDGD
jgi:hypothetical protein